MLANFVVPCVPCFHNETIVLICHSISSDQCRSEILFTNKYVSDFNHRKFGITGLFLRFLFISIDNERCLQGETFHFAALSNSSQSILIFCLQVWLLIGLSTSSAKEKKLWLRFLPDFWSLPLLHCLHLTDISRTTDWIDGYSTVFTILMILGGTIFRLHQQPILCSVGHCGINAGRCINCSGRCAFDSHPSR